MEFWEVDTETRKNILSTVITNLFDNGFITRFEKQRLRKKDTPEKTKSELYEILISRELSTVIEIFPLIQSIEKTEREKYKYAAQKVHNTMQNHVIIKKIFGFLNLEDLKSCRFVCLKWDKIAAPIIRKRSTISFSHSIENNRRVEEFLKTPFLSCSKISFTSFNFESGFSSNGPWDVTEVTNFFDSQRQNVEELKFMHIRLQEEGRRVKSFDLSNWISGMPAKSLWISAATGICTNTEIKAPLHLLQFVKILSIENCSICLGPGDRLSPAKLFLNRNKFFLDGQELKECRINDYFDLSKANDITIRSYQEINPKLAIDLSACSNLINLTLWNFVETNFGNSKCTVKCMDIRYIPMLERISMQVTELKFHRSSIDLAVLPSSIVKLELWAATVSCSVPISYPSLRNVSIYGIRNVSFLSNFINCFNLENLTFVEGYHVKMDTELIPKTVRKLKISRNVNIIGQTELQLEALVLVDSSFTFANKTLIFSKITSKILLLEWNNSNDDEDLYENPILFLRRFRNIEKFYLGPIHWGGSKAEFDCSLFSKYVNRQGSYYLFENLRGNVISEEEFQSVNF